MPPTPFLFTGSLRRDGLDPFFFFPVSALRFDVGIFTFDRKPVRESVWT